MSDDSIFALRLVGEASSLLTLLTRSATLYCLINPFDTFGHVIAALLVSYHFKHKSNTSNSNDGPL